MRYCQVVRARLSYLAPPDEARFMGTALTHLEDLYHQCVRREEVSTPSYFDNCFRASVAYATKFIGCKEIHFFLFLFFFVDW